jgi:hypothetical protein
MMSVKQRRQLIEAAFLPHVCKCVIGPSGLMTLKVSDATTGVVLLEVSDVRANNLVSWDAIEKFATDLQCDLMCDVQDDRRTG